MENWQTQEKNVMMTRRQALKITALTTSAYAVAASVPATAQNAGAGNPAPFKLPPLPYSFDALEPHIDARTMEIHHDKHHATYVANLNKALADVPELAAKSVDELLKDLNGVPEKAKG